MLHWFLSREVFTPRLLNCAIDASSMKELQIDFSINYERSRFYKQAFWRILLVKGLVQCREEQFCEAYFSTMKLTSVQKFSAVWFETLQCGI